LAGNISGVGKSENTLGHVYLRLGRYEEAMAHAAASLAISEQAGDRLDIAWAWMLIGDGHRGLGEVDQARELWQQALAEFERIDSSEAEQARQRLRDTDPSNDVPV
jgi:tetratricopeptide (TPR) repeat protein